MSSDVSDGDLPGFYKDPNTGKYFKLLPTGTSGMFSDNHGNNPVLPIDGTSQEERNMNVANLIVNRNIGLNRKTNFQREFFKLKTRGANVVNQFSFKGKNGNVDTLSDIQFLKRSKRTIIGCWTNADPNNRYKFYVGEMQEYLNPPKRKNYYYLNIFTVFLDVVDICECYSQQRCLAFVANHPRTGIGSVFVINPKPFEEGLSSARKLCSYVRSPIWCCSSNHVKSCFAVGIRKSINIYSTTSTLCSLTVPGNVHAVQFDRSGNLIFSGLHNGEITVSDLRARQDFVSCFPLSDHGVDEIKLFKDEHYAVCGDFNGRLCKVDARMNWRSVVEYEGHVHTPKKSPISFSERFDVLCGTGADSVTRLWSLEYGGKPIRHIASTEHPQSPSHAIVVNNASKCAIYHVAKNLVTVYEL